MPPIPDHCLLLKLQARGLEAPDPVRAEDFLRRVGFHRVQIYCWPLLKNPPDGRFVAGASFRHLAALCEFDGHLRHLALDALREVEIAARARVVRQLAEKDDCGHRRPELFRSAFVEEDHQRWLKRHDQNAKRFNVDKMAPVWESAEKWSFGELSTLFEGMNIADRRAISADFGDSGGNFTVESMHMMCWVRNTAAHHGRLWNQSTRFLPAMPKPGLVGDFNPPRGNGNKIYGALCVIARFIREVRPDSDWSGRLRALLRDKFPGDAPGLSVSQMGFPDDWERHSFWRQ